MKQIDKEIFTAQETAAAQVTRIKRFREFNANRWWHSEKLQHLNAPSPWHHISLAASVALASCRSQRCPLPVPGPLPSRPGAAVAAAAAERPSLKCPARAAEPLIPRPSLSQMLGPSAEFGGWRSLAAARRRSCSRRCGGALAAAAV